MQTKIITNFTGSLTRKDTGDLNSGLAKYATSWGYDPFSNPGSLSWMEKPSIISATLTYPLTAAKVRLDSPTSSSSVVTVYGWGGDAKLMKIQVNDPVSNNPNYDTGSVLSAAFGVNGQFGSSMQFYGLPEKIYIGHDSNIAKINFDGSGVNTSVATIASSVVSNVPRPSISFLGKLYFGNGTNLIEIDSTETVTSYAKLNPGFPVGTYIRDLDVTPDGNYLQMTVTRINGPNALGSLDLGPMTSVDSYKFYWNGTDSTYTSSTSYGGFALTSNNSFSSFNYTIGYDLGGVALYSDDRKIRSLPYLLSPTFGGTFSIGNMLGFMTPEYISSDTQTQASLFMYGQNDDETTPGLFRLLRTPHIPVSVLGNIPDILQIPICLPVSNLLYGANINAYVNNVEGTSKIYYSSVGQTLASLKGYLSKFTISPIGQASVVTGVWESQNELFSKKVRPSELRFYTEPLVGDNSFQIDLIGSSGGSVLGGSKIFTVHSSSVQSGADYVWWNPNVAPGYSWGTKITNLGTKNWTGIKLELDFAEAGR